MKRMLFSVAALAVGLGLGFVIVPHVFRNPWQQVALVRRMALVAAVVGLIYFTETRRHSSASGRGDHPQR